MNTIKLFGKLSTKIGFSKRFTNKGLNQVLNSLFEFINEKPQSFDRG